MADILRVTTPLVNKSQMVETKQNVDLASQFPIQDPTRVARPGAQSELLGQNNGMLQQEETSALLLSLLKDPSVTVNFLKSISSMEAVSAGSLATTTSSAPLRRHRNLPPLSRKMVTST